jgi:hypothetical protein
MNVLRALNSREVWREVASLAFTKFLEIFEKDDTPGLLSAQISE